MAHRHRAKPARRPLPGRPQLAPAAPRRARLWTRCAHRQLRCARFRSSARSRACAEHPQRPRAGDHRAALRRRAQRARDRRGDRSQPRQRAADPVAFAAADAGDSRSGAAPGRGRADRPGVMAPGTPARVFRHPGVLCESALSGQHVEPLSDYFDGLAGTRVLAWGAPCVTSDARWNSSVIPGAF